MENSLDLRLSPPLRFEQDQSASSGFASSGFASEGFRSETFPISDSDSVCGADNPPPYRRRRISLWQSINPTATGSDSSNRHQQLSSKKYTDESHISTLHEAAPTDPLLSAELQRGLLPAGDDHSDFLQDSCGAESEPSNDSQNLRDFLFNVHGIVSWRDLAKEEELRSLSDILEIVEKVGISEEGTRALLKTKRVSSRFSYDVLMKYLELRSKIPKHYCLMCPLEHMAMRGPGARGSVCSTKCCNLKIVESHIFWYRYASDMIAALCCERDSFEQLMEGCRRAKNAVLESDLRTFYDFYDGALFRRKYGTCLRNWNEEEELFVFLTFSSDGFEEIGGHRGPRTAWPLIFILLKLNPSHRFKAGNTLLVGFIPGTHDSDLFDTFLEPIIVDLSMLERGCYILCADGRHRKLRVFVMFVTADFPAASKILGFMGNSASLLCRYCHKKQTHVPEIGGRAALPAGSAKQRLRAISPSHDCHNFEWLDLECSTPRSNKETRETWRRLDAIRTTIACGMPTSKKKLRSSTGISRNPIIGRLQLDFVHSLPYDPMHLVFLGWVKHLLRLLFGLHDKTASGSTYVVSPAQRNVMNQALTDGAGGVPACWGRSPESLEHITSFRAEDFKNLGMFYGPIIFSGEGVERNISMLWGVTSNTIFITCDPTPSLEDFEVMRGLLQQAHALFTASFHIDVRHSFCFTPNTHAILHLADMLRECGPLPNVSQFTVERVIGDIGEMIGSMSRPEANLFHKTHMLFSHRLLCRGLIKLKETEISSVSGDVSEDGKSSDENNSEENRTTKKIEDTVLGPGKKLKSSSARLQTENWIRRNLGNEFNVDIIEIFGHERAKRATPDPAIFETESYFRRRAKLHSHRSRQKFWIAAHFNEENTGSSQQIFNSKSPTRTVQKKSAIMCITAV